MRAPRVGCSLSTLHPDTPRASLPTHTTCLGVSLHKVTPHYAPPESGRTGSDLRLNAGWAAAVRSQSDGVFLFAPLYSPTKQTVLLGSSPHTHTLSLCVSKIRAVVTAARRGAESLPTRLRAGMRGHGCGLDVLQHATSF